MPEAFVAYLRVSTSKQERSGLGLAAQRTIIEQFTRERGQLLCEFLEVESGRKDDRPQLWKAIAFAKQNKAKLLIARLDRFSRRVSFIAHIMESGVELVVAELPNATDFQLHIFAALAQEERRVISQRTRLALAEAKRRGTVLGRNGPSLALANQAAANERAVHLLPLLAPMLRVGASYSEMARQLNAGSHRTVTGKLYRAQQVSLIVARLATLR